MSWENIYRIGLVALLIFVVCYYWKQQVDSIPVNRKGFITAVAKQDLRTVGVYSTVLTNSVYNWLYLMFVTIFRQHPNVDLYKVLCSWNMQYNIDDEHYIQDGIEKAYTRFLKELEDKSFVCPNDYDYKSVARCIQYNDYLNFDMLLQCIDNEINNKEE